MTDALKAATGSPKTTVGGWLAAAAVLLVQLSRHFDGNQETLADWGLVIPAVVLAVTLTLARDNDKSSEDAGAK